MNNTERFLCEAIELARDNIRKGGRPFGAVKIWVSHPPADPIRVERIAGPAMLHWSYKLEQQR